MFGGWLSLLIYIHYYISPKQNDGFNSDVIQQRPLCNHYSHQHTDSCAVGPKVTKAVSEFLFVPTIIVTSELKHAGLELASKTKLRL